MPQKKDQSDKTVSKEAEEAARAAREKLFSAEAASRRPQTLSQTVGSFAQVLWFDKGKVTKDLAAKFEALRDEMVKATPPPPPQS